jgi:hypothetical protein
LRPNVFTVVISPADVIGEADRHLHPSRAAALRVGPKRSDENLAERARIRRTPEYR